MSKAGSPTGIDSRTGGLGARLVAPLILALPLIVVALFWRFSPQPDPTVHGPTTPRATAQARERIQAQVQAQVGAQAQDQETPPSTPGAASGDGDVEGMAARLAARLEREPDDANGWSLLAHTYYVMKRFGQAAEAYEKLVALVPPDANVLADYADALAMAQGRSLEGKPMELVHKALEHDPTQWKALSMAATDAFQRNDFRLAIAYWERALAAVAPDSDMSRAIQSSLAQARQSSASAAGTSR